MLKEQEIVICTIKKVEGTTVFVDIEDNGEGSLVFSEIAAGRIRNLREYVHPNKKIVCKVLKIAANHIELSLRRVTGKEREEALEKYEKEKTITKILKTITTDADKIIEKIKEKYDLSEFYDQARENQKILSDFFKKEEIQKLSPILAEKKEKDKIVKKTLSLKTQSESGLSDIKNILDEKNVDMHYLGSGSFSISATAKDFKEADNKVKTAISNIEKKAKEKKAILEIKEK